METAHSGLRGRRLMKNESLAGDLDIEAFIVSHFAPIRLDGRDRSEQIPT